MSTARSLRPSRRLIAAAAAALAVLVPAAAAHAAAATLPRVTISPLKGTPDASPTTQISFLGVGAKDITRISVRGDRSGGHRGTLKPYATGTGASYVLLRPFTPAETVTVSATETVAGRSRVIGTTFTVASLYVPPASFYVAPPSAPPPAPGAHSSFLTAPGLRPPTITVTSPAADPGLGDIFLTPVDGGLQAGPMIVNPAGQLVWFAPEPARAQATDLRVQSYLGQKALTYWQGRVVLGHGSGSGVIDNASYQQIAKVSAGNGLSMDLHDFDLEPGGVALITVYEPVWWNLSAGHGPSHGVLEDCVVQEIDVRTGLVMFEWHALGHVPLSASYTQAHLAPDNHTEVWDWFHINSIDLEPDRNLLISSRNTWSVYQVGHTFGEVLWTLGGKHSSFTLGPGVRFAWQHDATLLADGSIEIFDNEDTPAQAPRSRGIDVGLDLREAHRDAAARIRGPAGVRALAQPGRRAAARQRRPARRLGADRPGLRALAHDVADLPAEAAGERRVLPRLPLPVGGAARRAARGTRPSAPPVRPPRRSRRAGTGRPASPRGRCWPGAPRRRWRRSARRSLSTGFETQIDASRAPAPYVAVEALGVERPGARHVAGGRCGRVVTGRCAHRVGRIGLRSLRRSDDAD